jgi:hypothetical protein
VYAVQQTSAETPYQLYDVTYGLNSSIMSKSDIHVTVNECGSTHITAPSFYSIRAGTFHDTVVPTGVFTATLVLVRDSLSDGDVKTVGDARGQARYEYDRATVNPGEQGSIIDRLSDLF